MSLHLEWIVQCSRCIWLLFRLCLHDSSDLYPFSFLNFRLDGEIGSDFQVGIVLFQSAVRDRINIQHPSMRHDWEWTSEFRETFCLLSLLAWDQSFIEQLFLFCHDQLDTNLLTVGAVLSNEVSVETLIDHDFSVVHSHQLNTRSKGGYKSFYLVFVLLLLCL